MKKYAKLLLLLAVVGMAASCEKDVVDRTNGNEVNKPTNTTDDSDDTAKKDIVGCWEYTAVADTESEFESRAHYVFYFWEDGNGYLTIDGYNNAERIISITRNSLTYWFKNGKLYVKYGNSPAIEWEYRFKDNTLIMRSDMDEYGNTFVFTKAEEGDMRFVGDWSTSRSGNNDDHIKFVTPTDGFTYHSSYDDPNAAPVGDPSEMVWFKYSFDDTMLTITYIDSATTSKRHYRFEGDKLYLGDENGGSERCYSKIGK